MTRIPVESSNLKSVGYENGVLEVEFHNKSIYWYLHVPHEVHRLLMSAESKGKFFTAHIKGRYSYQKIR